MILMVILGIAAAVLAALVGLVLAALAGVLVDRYTFRRWSNPKRWNP